MSMVGSYENSKGHQNNKHSYEDKIRKAYGFLLNPPDMDVGTASHEVVYEDGKFKLLHYHPVVPEPHRVPLLVIYALINKPYILDLQPDRSVIRRLLMEGFDVYMIDWGTPTEIDKYNTLDDYVNWYINDAVDHIRRRHDLDSISILGYCMGGSLSVMFTGIHPEKVRNLVLMAAPLDFDADQGLLKLWSKKEYFDPDKLVDTVGNVPGEFLNFGYLLLDPVNNIYTKYLKFIDKVDDEKFVQMFFRMEKWINDGIPVAGEAFREFIKKCYQHNELVSNKLHLNGHHVDLNNISMPILSLVAQYDHLVPPESSMSFNDLVGSSDKEMIMFPTGHIGLSVSSSTHTTLWPRVASWLEKRSDVEEGMDTTPANSKITSSKGRSGKGKQRKKKSTSKKGKGTKRKSGTQNVKTAKKNSPAGKDKTSGRKGTTGKKGSSGKKNTSMNKGKGRR
jgi:polyhydroxyalkanoate synthase